ncbi:unnamed protein product [Auanema sp. JU1783]|nr:unnamed protein product [Auanema sp. JU1783]
MGFQFKLPSQTTVIGATQSGKTTLIKHICENTEKYFAQPIDKIFWFSQCGSSSGVPLSDGRLVVVEGPPDAELIKDQKGRNSIVVLDDLMNYFSSSKEAKQLLNNIFTVWAHHWNLAVFNLVQAAFQLDRTSRINSTYLILMKSHSDVLQIRNCLQQLFGTRFKSAFEAYTDAMSKPYNHLLIDNHPLTNDRHRILTDITSEYPIVYIARSII